MKSILNSWYWNTWVHLIGGKNMINRVVLVGRLTKDPDFGGYFKDMFSGSVSSFLTTHSSGLAIQECFLDWQAND